MAEPTIERSATNAIERKENLRHLHGLDQGIRRKTGVRNVTEFYIITNLALFIISTETSLTMIGLI